MMLTEELKKIHDELLMKVDTNINLEDVILSDENKAKIMEVLEEHKHKEIIIKHGLLPMNKLLFYGASGCGKTYLAKALSNYLGYKMLYIDIARSISEGNAAVNISNVFKLANTLKNCLIFLDECDSIAWNRDTSLPDRGDIRRATNSLFQNLDQMDPSNLFIAATNILHRLDPAFERRFDIKLEFRRPSGDLVDIIKRFVFPEFKLIDDVDETTKEIVERRKVLSFAEIKGIVHRAMKKALINNTTVVRTSDIYNDFYTAMGIKRRFRTDEDTEDTFKSSIV